MFLRFAAASAVVALGLIASSSDHAGAQGYPYVRPFGPPPPAYEVAPADPDDLDEESVAVVPTRPGLPYPEGSDRYTPSAPGFLYPEQPESTPYGHTPGRGQAIQRGELPAPGTAGLPADANAPRPPGAVGPGGQPQIGIGPGGQPPVISTLPPEDQPEVGEPKELPPHLRRQLVDYRTKEPAGTIVIDTANTYLYLVLGDGQAMRYGIGVGREGFTWQGVERVSRMAEWPDWHPPEEMIQRQPYLPRFMAGGESNPLGARALYLGKTLYRIHGTNQPSTIGSFVSSGCVRLVNADIQDLYERVKVGTRVVVIAGKPPATAHKPPGSSAQALPPPTTAQASPHSVRTR